jgi:chromosome segregation ATPase
MIEDFGFRMSDFGFRALGLGKIGVIMRCIPVIVLLGAASALAQTTEPDRQTNQALLVEVQQLRRAIERSTLLGTRTQIALQRIQMQEARVTRLSQELDRERKDLAAVQARQTNIAEHAKYLEDRAPQLTDPNARKQVEGELRQVKIEGEQLAAQQLQAQARSAALASQLQGEAGRLTDLQDRVSEMERTLDAAIRQLTSEH